MAFLLSRRRFAALSACAAAQDPFGPERAGMLRGIEGRGVRDPKVLDALRNTPRHLFVPAGERAHAYEDRPLPIGHGQTISQPYIVAVMTQLLELDRSHRVLEIGTGSGYQAAVLARLAGTVYSLEIVPELAKASAVLLAVLGLDNVVVRHGDGYRGWPEQAPFDRVILTAAPPALPQPLVDQLKPGGRLIGPVGGGPETQELIVVDKRPDGQVLRRSVLPVRFVPMVRPR